MSGRAAGNSIDIDVPDVLAQLEKGIPLSAIARKIGCSRPTLYKRMEAYDKTQEK